MPSITIKNIPQKTYELLKAKANDHHRSLNGEILHLLDEATRSRRIDVKGNLNKIRTLRESLGFEATPEEIEAFKQEGRR